MIRPRECPSASVLRIHMTPIGPIGTAIANPMTNPLKRKISSMISRSNSSLSCHRDRVAIFREFLSSEHHEGFLIAAVRNAAQSRVSRRHSEAARHLHLSPALRHLFSCPHNCRLNVLYCVPQILSVVNHSLGKCGNGLDTL